VKLKFRSFSNGSPNVTIIILNIIHLPALYLKYKVSKTGIYLLLQVEPKRVGPIDRAGLCLRTGGKEREGEREREREAPSTGTT
jgi:hypothetical protein